MKKLISFFLVLLFGIAGVAFAATPTMDVVQVSPGVADLKFGNTAGVWLVNRPDTSQRFYAVNDKPDEAGKGKADMVFYAANPKLFNGRLFCVTFLGPDWARGKKQFDVNKLQCAPMKSDVAVRLTVPAKYFGSTFGITPLVITPNEKGENLLAWGAHGPNHYLLKRPNGTKDVVTLLHIDTSGSIRAATEVEKDRYQRDVYPRFF